MADVIEKLSYAITTASNDDTSEPRSEKRKRHVQRIDAMNEAIDEISRLRTALWQRGHEQRAK